MSGAVNTCKRTVGQLIEIRVDAGYRTPEDVDAMAAMIAAEVNALRSDARIIIAADWRRCTVFGPGTADRAVAMFLRANPRTLRSSILMDSGSPTAVMQLTRIISEAKFADRRLFTSPNEQIAWLGEIMTPEESARLRSFLDRRDGASK